MIRLDGDTAYSMGWLYTQPESGDTGYVDKSWSYKSTTTGLSESSCIIRPLPTPDQPRPTSLSSASRQKPPQMAWLVDSRGSRCSPLFLLRAQTDPKQGGTTPQAKTIDSTNAKQHNAQPASANTHDLADIGQETLEGR